MNGNKKNIKRFKNTSKYSNLLFLIIFLYQIFFLIKFFEKKLTYQLIELEKTRIPPQNTCKTIETQSNIEREQKHSLRFDWRKATIYLWFMLQQRCVALLSFSKGRNFCACMLKLLKCLKHTNTRGYTTTLCTLKKKIIFAFLIS